MMIIHSRFLYVSVIYTLNVQHVTPSNELKVPGTKGRYMQRLLSNANTYGTGKPKFETMMLQAGKICTDGIKYNKKRFCKPLGFQTMKRKRMVIHHSEICMPHYKVNCEECMRIEPTQFSYVQHYDVLGKEDLPKDSVDNMLYYRHFKWEWYGEDNEGR